MAFGESGVRKREGVKVLDGCGGRFVRTRRALVGCGGLGCIAQNDW